MGDIESPHWFDHIVSASPRPGEVSAPQPAITSTRRGLLQPPPYTPRNEKQTPVPARPSHATARHTCRLRRPQGSVLTTRRPGSTRAGVRLAVIQAVVLWHRVGLGLGLEGMHGRLDVGPGRERTLDGRVDDVRRGEAEIEVGRQVARVLCDGKRELFIDLAQATDFGLQRSEPGVKDLRRLVQGGDIICGCVDGHKSVPLMLRRRRAYLAREERLCCSSGWTGVRRP